MVRARVVFRAVVDDQDLIHWACLREDTFERLVDVTSGVIGRDDYADGHALTLSSTLCRGSAERSFEHTVRLWETPSPRGA